MKQLAKPEPWLGWGDASRKWEALRRMCLLCNIPQYKGHLGSSNTPCCFWMATEADHAHFYLSEAWRMHPILDIDLTMEIHALVTSRLNYCNSYTWMNPGALKKLRWYKMQQPFCIKTDFTMTTSSWCPVLCTGSPLNTENNSRCLSWYLKSSMELVLAFYEITSLHNYALLWWLLSTEIIG